MSAVILALKRTLVTLAACAIILLITMIPYQKVVIDGAPEEPEQPETDPALEEVMGREEGWLFSGFPNLLKAQQKKGMEDRWHMNDIPKDQLTPEQRISKSIYRILLLFCLVILLPTLYSTLEGGADPNRLNSLAYVISGNWQKGVNIFAVTSCVFLLCAMYVVVVLVNQILYRIAKISDIAKMISRRPAHRFSIAEMAKHAKMSESYFTALFRSVVGLPPYAYLSKCRLDMARTRLAETTASVADIAHDLGFASPQHLATQFRKTYGLTPTEWRKQPNG